MFNIYIAQNTHVQGRTERSVHRTRTEARYCLGARHDWSKKLPHFEHKLVCRFINLPAISAILDFNNYHAYEVKFYLKIKNY